MRLPKQARPVIRSVDIVSQFELSMSPSQCPPGISGEIGRCFFDDSGPTNGYNCVACCAIRHAVSWYGPNTGAINCSH